MARTRLHASIWIPNVLRLNRLYDLAQQRNRGRPLRPRIDQHANRHVSYQLYRLARGQPVATGVRPPHIVETIDANIKAVVLNESRWLLLGILVEPLAFTS